MIQALRELWKPGLGRVARRLLRHPLDDARPGTDRAGPDLLGRPYRCRAAAGGPLLRRLDRQRVPVGRGGALHRASCSGYRTEYGRESDPFEIIVGFYDRPRVDLYQRAAEELGVTGTIACRGPALDATSDGRHDGGLLESALGYRESIVRFADEIVSKLK